MPVGWIMIPAPTGPGCSTASKSVTACPARAMKSADADPAVPAPTTATFNTPSDDIGARDYQRARLRAAGASCPVTLARVLERAVTAPRIGGRLRADMRRVLASCVLLVSGLLSGCVSVAPYEREYLASPAMNAELEEGEGEFSSHVFDSREGATGGHGSTGGGCGCN